jgi:hypothetical protein
MTSDTNGIIYLANSYFFLRTSSFIGCETKKYRITDIERRARKAIIKFSTDDNSSINEYLPEEQNEIISWINVAIAECNKRLKRTKS